MSVSRIRMTLKAKFMLRCLDSVAKDSVKSSLNFSRKVECHRLDVFLFNWFSFKVYSINPFFYSLNMGCYFMIFCNAFVATTKVHILSTKVNVCFILLLLSIKDKGEIVVGKLSFIPVRNGRVFYRPGTLYF
jgi:hypothetical protein